MTHHTTNKPAKTLVLVALLAVLGVTALVRPAREADALAAGTLTRLLEQPIDVAPGVARDERPTFWRALLDSPMTESGADGVRLSLGRVLADPSSARASAEGAGELLELEAEGPDGPLGVPLWRAILERAVVSDGSARTLAVYGCRHSADADAGPVLEDTYHARLALVRRLRELARTDEAAGPLTIRGEEVPVKGGINFEVQLDGERQWVRVTFDGGAWPALRAARAGRPPAPNDARARAGIVACLTELAAREPSLGTLTIEGREAPVVDGVDLRLERYGGRLALVARRGGTRVATHLTLDAETPAKGAGSAPATQ